MSRSNLPESLTSFLQNLENEKNHRERKRLDLHKT